VKWVLAGIGSLVLVIVLFLVSRDSTERDFDARINANDLDGAYAIYQKALSAKGPSSSLIQRLNTRALPLLKGKSDGAYQNWYRNSDISPLTWDVLARSEEWRIAIEQSSESRAKQRYALGMVAFDKNMFGEARSDFEQALSLQPGWPLAINAIGRCYFRLQDFNMAARYYHNAADADPNWQFPPYNLGNLYRDKLHNNSEAEIQYRKAIQLDPKRSSFHYGLAILYFYQGKAHAAETCQEFRSALSGSSPLPSSEVQFAQKYLKRCP
jgi:tetratricopeptide (TPR) repeat protein